MARNVFTDAFAFENPGSAVYGALRNQGIDPSHSYLSGAIKRRTQLFPTMLNLQTFGPGDAESQAVPLANQFVSGMFGQGANPFSQQGIDSLIARFTDAQQGTPEYETLHTGDIKDDYAAWQNMRNLQLVGSNPLYAGARRGLDERQFAELAGQIAQGQAPNNASWLETVLGRPMPQVSAAPPAAPPATTPPPATPPPAAGPPAAPPTPAPAPAPAPTPAPGGGAAAPINNLAALLQRFQADQRNWGTEGYRPNAPIDIQIGNERFRYNGAEDQVRDWRNMSSTGRTTHRGNFLGQMLYYLNLLNNQRKGEGNQALGITRNTDDATILRLAQQRMGRNAVGNTGWRYDRTG